MLVDSHCHLNMLDLKPFNGALEGVIEAAEKVGVTKMLCIATELKTMPEVFACADKFANVYATAGIHPSDSAQNLISVAEIIKLAQHPKVVGIGETGLDYYYDHSDRNTQQESFIKHIDAAKQLDLPLVIHTRSAQEDTIEIMKNEGAEQCGAVMHCFTEDWDMAKKALDMGFYISISGIVTFKNAHQVKDVASRVPMDRLLVETDSPFLAPVPYRGKPNYPAYVRDVATYVAFIRGMDYEDLAQQTTDNFHRLFKGAAK